MSTGYKMISTPKFPKFDPEGGATDMEGNMDNSPSSDKRVVEVHVTFLKIGEISTLKEMYEADIMVKSRWREPELDDTKESELADIDWDSYWNPKIIIDNVRPDVKETFSRTVTREDGEAYVRERRRFRGTFMEQLELWEFPFDIQDLSVAVMSDLPSTEVELMETSEDVHRIYRQSFIDEQEYYLYKYVGTEKRDIAKDRADPSVRRSTIFVTCAAARRPAYFIYNMFAVTFIIAVLSFLIYAVPPSLIQNRLQLGFTLVLTSVAFKFVATSSLPKISYLTYLDRYVLATMSVVSVNTVWHGLQVLIPKTADGRSYPDYVAFAVMLIGYIIYNLQFMARIWLVPYRHRRNMVRKETQYIGRLRMRTAERQGSSSDDDDVMQKLKPRKQLKKRPNNGPSKV